MSIPSDKLLRVAIKPENVIMLSEEGIIDFIDISLSTTIASVLSRVMIKNEDIKN
ncbi:MAG: hypothetical protein AB8U25_06325 [Rickettsiales endosymbiont of Dermacentor nuttalli]